MGESHSTMLVRQAIEDVQRYLDAEAKGELPTTSTSSEVHARGELPTASTLREVQNVSLARTLNRALRHVNLHVTRATIHDETMRTYTETMRTYDKAMRRDYVPIVKSIALGTLLQVQSDPTEFDAVYDALSGEDSHRIFDWLISYRTALAFVGQDAGEVVHGMMSMDEWQKVLDRTVGSLVGGAFYVDGVKVDSGLPEVATTFFLEQYRLGGVVEPRAGDVVLDCGAYKGETTLWFARQVGTGGRVIAFEPAAQNADALRQNLIANQGVEMAPVTVLECAVSNVTGVLAFNAQAEALSRVDATSEESVPAVMIDDVVEEQRLSRVDFIKMDIEGGEVDALRGARETLKRFTPRLAISVYHRPNDLPDIVTLVRQACPNYRLYLSHKSPGLAETVLFAVAALHVEDDATLQTSVAR